MKIGYLFIITCFVSFLVGAQEQDSIAVQSIVKVELATRTAIDSSLEIEFVKVLSDSRCPKDVQCIWAGEAKILVKVYRNGVFESEDQLTIHPRVLEVAVLEKLSSKLTRIKALQLFPYPDTAASALKNEYYIEFSIEQ